MTDERVPDLSDDDRMLAAEHALGVDEGTARARAARRAAHEPAFRAEVEAWEARLEPMLDEVADETPPARVWRGVEAAIGRADAREPKASMMASAPVPARAPTVSRAPTLAERVQRATAPAMAPWRALSLMGLGGAMAALALVVAVERDVVRLGPAPATAPSTAPALVATLVAGDAPSALARVDGRGALVVRISALGGEEGGEDGAEDGLVPQLWLIPTGGSPISLGLPGEGVAVALPDGVVPSSGETLAVSLEPPGGSRTGAPTGPVVATGTLVEL